jgi:uncharacterized protein with von Willebrand factor type A (vWA) domain
VNSSNLLEQEYERFIAFGQILDRKMRTYLVTYLRQKLEQSVVEEPAELDNTYLRYFTQAIDQLTGIQGLLSLCAGNEQITRQVVIDTLRWLRKSWTKSRVKNPYENEIRRLEQWSVTPVKAVAERWPVLLNTVRNLYPKEQLDSSFYSAKFKGLLLHRSPENLSAEGLREVDRLLHDLLAKWDALLHARILDFQLNTLQREIEEYTSLTAAKVEEYQRLVELVSPFSEYMGRYWDLSRALWKDTSFDIVRQYHEFLQNESSIRELADLLGQMREAELEIEEEQFEKTISRQEWISDPLQKAELVGVEESDDLNNLLSAEAGLLGDDDTEWLFLHKYANRRLLTFQYEDRRLVTSKHTEVEVNRKVRQKEKGPFILCVDTSESMAGKPEQIAKVMSMGILKMAARENRKAFLINFSAGVKTLDLHSIADSIDQIAAFLRMSFHGGTDISLALNEALRQLENQDYHEADILMVSDFIMYRVDRDTLQQVHKARHSRGTRFHSLTLSQRPNRKILEAFDTNWVYDPEGKGIVRELRRSLEEIR